MATPHMRELVDILGWEFLVCFAGVVAYDHGLYVIFARVKLSCKLSTLPRMKSYYFVITRMYKSHGNFGIGGNLVAASSFDEIGGNPCESKGNRFQHPNRRCQWVDLITVLSHLKLAQTTIR